MITLTYKELNAGPFIQAMQALNATKLPTQVAYQISKITLELNRAMKKIGEEYQAETASFGQDEEGQKARAKFDEEFGTRVVNVSRFPIHISQLGGVTMAPGDLCALEKIVTDEISSESIAAGATVTPLHGT
jgi:hypothetical protein